MALINCPECTREISDKAERCPHCGHPVIIKNTDIQSVVDEPITCPKCSSKDIALLKEGFNAHDACCGAVLLGPLGLLCGASESNNLNRHCLKCGHKWPIQQPKKSKYNLVTIIALSILILGLFGYVLKNK